MRKLLIVAEMRALEKQVNLGEISYSLMIEIINEKAEEYATLKLQEKDKEIEELKSKLFIEECRNEMLIQELTEFQTSISEQAKEIERLKGENDNNEEHF